MRGVFKISIPFSFLKKKIENINERYSTIEPLKRQYEKTENWRDILKIILLFFHSIWNPSVFNWNGNANCHSKLTTWKGYSFGEEICLLIWVESSVEIYKGWDNFFDLFEHMWEFLIDGLKKVKLSHQIKCHRKSLENRVIRKNKETICHGF